MVEEALEVTVVANPAPPTVLQAKEAVVLEVLVEAAEEVPARPMELLDKGMAADLAQPTDLPAKEETAVDALARPTALLGAETDLEEAARAAETEEGGLARPMEPQVKVAAGMDLEVSTNQCLNYCSGFFVPQSHLLWRRVL